MVTPVPPKAEIKLIPITYSNKDNINSALTLVVNKNFVNNLKLLWKMFLLTFLSFEPYLIPNRRSIVIFLVTQTR